MLAGLTLVLLINGLIRQTFDPSWFYGNSNLEIKMKLYQPQVDSFNTLFIGSSTLFYNLDPIRFDSLMPAEWDIHSYNLGGGGSLPPETYHFTEQLIRAYPGKIRNIVLELRDIAIFSDNHRNTLRKRYWLTPGWYAFIMQALSQADLPDSLRLQTALYTTESFMERSFNLGYFNNLFGNDLHADQVSEVRLQDVAAANRRGMLPVTAEKEQDRRGQFFQDTSRLSRIASEYRSIITNPMELVPSAVHLKKLKELIETCRQSGIHLVLLLHPKMEPVQVRETMALARGIPDVHLIDLSDPDRYPELYLVENSLNYNHFNQKGTLLLTDHAARSFIRVHSLFLSSESQSRKQRTDININ